MFNIPEITSLLLVTLKEFVFECLDVWFHFIGVQDTDIVDSPFALEFAHLSVEELDIVIQVDSLVVCLQLGWRQGKPFFDTYHPVTHFQVFSQVLVYVITVHVVHQTVNEFYFSFKLMFGLVKLQSFELAIVIDRLWQMINVTYFNWLDLEFIVFTFTDNNWLCVLFEILVVIFAKLVPETHFIIIDDVMVMINVILNLRLSFCLLVPAHN